LQEFAPVSAYLGLRLQEFAKDLKSPRLNLSNLLKTLQLASVGEGGDDGGISHLVLQNGGKHRGAVLYRVPALIISASGRGVLADATMPDGRKLRPGFTPSGSSHDVKERRNERCIARHRVR